MNTIVQTPTDGTNSSLEFYKRLKFETLPSDEETLVSDGNVIIQLNPERFARPGIKLYKTSWEDEVDHLKKIDTPVVQTAKGYLLSDRSGTWIYLIEGKSPVPENIPSISSSLIGNFAGLGLEVISIESNLKLWNTIGFSQYSGSVDNGWVSLKNADGIAVSLMKPLVCPHLFSNPSLSYFNGGQNLDIIKSIKNQRIQISEEITVFNKEGIVDNIIIHDPGGLGFFIFND